MPRNEGGRGLLQVKQIVEEEKRASCDYIQNSTENAVKAVSQEHTLSIKGPKQYYRQEDIKKRRDIWQTNARHGQYLKDFQGKVDINVDLKKDTEGFLLAARDQTERINAIKAKIDKTTDNCKSQFCKKKEKTIDYLFSTGSKIAQSDYKERYNKVASMLHWNLCKKYSIHAAGKWREHKVEKIILKDYVRIL